MGYRRYGGTQTWRRRDPDKTNTGSPLPEATAFVSAPILFSVFSPLISQPNAQNEKLLITYSHEVLLSESTL